MTTEGLLLFFLVFSRVGGLVVTAPLLNNQTIPTQVKLYFSAVLALLLFLVRSPSFVPPTDLWQFTGSVLQEFSLGLMLGFAANMAFSGVQMAGEYIAMQMGLSVANVMDPVTRTHVPILGQFYFFFAFFLFLMLNMHHWVIIALEKSYQYLPLGAAMIDPALLVDRFMVLSGQIFTLALLVGLPVMGLLLVMEVALGFVAKVMPQMNIFMVGMPLKIMFGMWAMSITLPAVSQVLHDQFGSMVRTLPLLFLPR